MPIAPDLPFPKGSGDALRSKDWNDLVTETQRLDNAKVNRNGDDTISGSLTVSGALGVGTAATTTAKLSVSGNLRINDGNMLLRGGSDDNHGVGWFGTGKQFAGASYDGPVLFGFNGGALGTTNGGQKAALAWNTSGCVGIGTDAPADFRLRVGGRAALQQQNLLSIAGDADVRNQDLLNLVRFGSQGDYQIIHKKSGHFGRNTLALHCDNADAIGIYSSGWTPLLEVAGAAGDLYVKGSVGAGNSDLYFTKTDHKHTGLGNVDGNAAIENASDYNALMILGRSGTQIPGRPAGTKGRVVRLWDFLEVNGDMNVTGRMQDQKIRASVSKENKVDTTSTAWVQMPDMSITFTAPLAAYFHVTVEINGVQAYGVGNAGAYFRIRVDGNVWDLTRHEFNNNGWELRGIYLSALPRLDPGPHNVTVEWLVSGGTLSCSWYGDSRRITIIEL